MPTSGVRDNCGDMPLPPVDLARSTLSGLAPTGGVAPVAPGYRFLGRDNDQASGCCPEHLAMAIAGWVCSQGSESNNRWCSIAMSSSAVLSEVVGLQLVLAQGSPVLVGHDPLWSQR